MLGLSSFASRIAGLALVGNASAKAAVDSFGAASAPNPCLRQRQSSSQGRGLQERSPLTNARSGASDPSYLRLVLFREVVLQLSALRLPIHIGNETIIRSFN